MDVAEREEPGRWPGSSQRRLRMMMWFAAAALFQFKGKQFFLGSRQVLAVASAGLAFLDPYLKRPRFDLLFEVFLILFHPILLISRCMRNSFGGSSVRGVHKIANTFRGALLQSKQGRTGNQSRHGRTRRPMGSSVACEALQAGR